MKGRTKDKGQRTKELPKANGKWVGGINWAVETSAVLDRDDSEAWVMREEHPQPARPAKVYDLLERTALFGEAIVRFAKRIPRNPVNDRLIGQLVGAGTSVGANYCEADDAVSKKDFRNKIGTCRKEAKECKFWLRMIAAADESLIEEARGLWREASELHLIFCATFRKCSQ